MKKFDREFFVKSGSKGGETTKAKHPRSYYSEIGKKGVRAKKAKKKMERLSEGLGKNEEV